MAKAISKRGKNGRNIALGNRKMDSKDNKRAETSENGQVIRMTSLREGTEDRDGNFGMHNKFFCVETEGSWRLEVDLTMLIGTTDICYHGTYVPIA